MFHNIEPQNPKKKKMAERHSLDKFFNWQKIDIQQAYNDWYIDGIKALFLYILRKLNKYEQTYRKSYKDELHTCVKVMQLEYFSLEESESIERFLWQTQKEIYKEYETFNHNIKNDHIQEIFDHDTDVLWIPWQKIPEDQRATLMMSLYNSYIHSKKKTPEQRRRRYNRLFFIQQIENKKIYYPHNRFASARAVNENIAELLLPPKNIEK